jgi:hypothetical protein
MRAQATAIEVSFHLTRSKRSFSARAGSTNAPSDLLDVWARGSELNIESLLALTGRR